MSIETIQDYINSLDEKTGAYITDFIDYMHREYPQFAPRISFSMPMWYLGQKMNEGYVAISPAKKHYSIHFGEEAYIEAMKKQLPGCSFGKRCINIRYGDEQALSTVKLIIHQYLTKR